MAKVMNDIAQRLAARGGRAQPAGADPTAELRVRLEAAVEVMQEGLVERDTEVGACGGPVLARVHAADCVASTSQDSASLAGPPAARSPAGALASAGATGVSAIQAARGRGAGCQPSPAQPRRRTRPARDGAPGLGNTGTQAPFSTHARHLCGVAPLHWAAPGCSLESRARTAAVPGRTPAMLKQGGGAPPGRCACCCWRRWRASTSCTWARRARPRASWGGAWRSSTTAHSLSACSRASRCPRSCSGR